MFDSYDIEKLLEEPKRKAGFSELATLGEVPDRFTNEYTFVEVEEGILVPEECLLPPVKTFEEYICRYWFMLLLLGPAFLFFFVSTLDVIHDINSEYRYYTNTISTVAINLHSVPTPVDSSVQNDPYFQSKTLQTIIWDSQVLLTLFMATLFFLILLSTVIGARSLPFWLEFNRNTGLVTRSKNRKSKPYLVCEFKKLKLSYKVDHMPSNMGGYDNLILCLTPKNKEDIRNYLRQKKWYELSVSGRYRDREFSLLLQTGGPQYIAEVKRKLGNQVGTLITAFFAGQTGPYVKDREHTIRITVRNKKK